jgi:hypothetical protein
MSELERNYRMFCNDLCDILDKDFSKIEDRFITGYRFLNHIPVNAWKPMVKVAVDAWASWPRNWAKAVNEIYELWRSDEKVQRQKSECHSCNSIGFFEGSEQIEVKPNIYMPYWHVWRCGHCANWMGILGEKVPISNPQEIIDKGFKLRLFTRLDESGSTVNRMPDIVNMVGVRVNPKQNRPEIQRYTDEVPF